MHICDNCSCIFTDKKILIKIGVSLAFLINGLPVYRYKQVKTFSRCRISRSDFATVGSSVKITQNHGNLHSFTTQSDINRIQYFEPFLGRFLSSETAYVFMRKTLNNGVFKIMIALSHSIGSIRGLQLSSFDQYVYLFGKQSLTKFGKMVFTYFTYCLLNSHFS